MADELVEAERGLRRYAADPSDRTLPMDTDVELVMAEYDRRGEQIRLLLDACEAREEAGMRGIQFGTVRAILNGGEGRE